MNAKHSAVLLSGLLLLMIGIAWAQTTSPARPTCPADGDNGKWAPGSNTSKWVRADWNANTEVWDIDCSEPLSLLDAEPSNSMSNFMRMSNTLPSRGRGRSNGNSNYINTDPYNSSYNSAANAAANSSANVAANLAVNAASRPKSRTKRRPN